MGANDKMNKIANLLLFTAVIFTHICPVAAATITYVYDDLGRLEEVIYPEESYHISYLYDDVGNIQETATGYLDTDQDGLNDVLENAGCTDSLVADSDSDGLADGVEDSNHDGILDAVETDPCNPDTDGDAMSDGWEVLYGLNPLDSSDADMDSDGDGLSNMDEFGLGTDPILTDTDGDGVDDGFDGYPLDDTLSECPVTVICYETTEPYSSLQEAFDDPLFIDGDMIQCTAGEFIGDFQLNQDKTFVLDGGFFCTYTGNPSSSTIAGSLTISNGRLLCEKIIIK